MVKRMQISLCAALLTAMSVALLGCDNGADENKPMSEVTAEAKQMDVDQLMDTAKSYQKALQDKMAQMSELKDKLSQIPMTEMMGQEAQDLKTEIDQLMKSIDALKQRFEVYVNQLKEMNADVSGLTVPS